MTISKVAEELRKRRYDEDEYIDKAINICEAWEQLKMSISGLKDFHGDNEDYKLGYVEALSGIQEIMRGLEYV